MIREKRQEPVLLDAIQQRRRLRLEITREFQKISPPAEVTKRRPIE